MKIRWLFVCGLAIVLTMLWRDPVFADNPPHDGNYTATTDSCAGCHRTHTGSGAGLLKMTAAYNLCMACHGVTSGGANTNVRDGVYVATNAPLKGGGFVNARMNTNLGASAVSGAVTSKHAVNGMTGYAPGRIWGIGAINSGAGTTFTLECYSCHDPHGKSGAGATATYRVLRSVPRYVTGATTFSVPDVITKEYTIKDTTGRYYGENYPASNDTNLTENTKITALTSWCSTCHTRIHATGASGATSSGDAIFAYRHRTDGSNISTSSANGAPACMTCHVAHGSRAAMGTYSSAVPKPGTAEGGGSYLDSALLRIDNRGVCEICHNK
ncbi:MAG: cytochrome c3 family protein [Chloroflexi bacterium]|nr:cytochrome c3 family protein [Chloroflexota bacterium]